MKVRHHLQLILTIVLGTGAFFLPVRAQTTRVQFVHASADPALEVVDVYLGADLTIDNFTYQSATPFMDILADVPINVSIAGGASSAAAEADTAFTVTFQTGLSYYVVIAGVQDPALFPPNPDEVDTSMRLFVADDARESSTDPGSFQVRQFQALFDAPTYDFLVDLPGGDVLIHDNLSFGAFTDYEAEVPQFWTGLVTPPTDHTEILFSVLGDFRNLADVAFLEMPVGFFGPAPFPDAPGIDWMWVFPDGTITFSEVSREVARVQFVHASLDPRVAFVDIYLDNVLWLDGFTRNHATPFSDVPVGGHTIAIAPSSSASAEESVATFDFSLQAGKAYHMVAAGVLDPVRFPANPDGRDTSLDLYIEDAALESARFPTTGFFDVRDFHAVIDWPTVDFSADVPGDGVTDLWAGLAFGEFSENYSGVTRSGVAARMHPSGDRDSILFAAQVDFSGEDRLAFLGVWTGVSGMGRLADLIVRPDGSLLEYEVVTNANNAAAGLPAKYRLASNYPDPFSRTTTITYDLSQPTEATLTVFDLLGRMVGVVASGKQPAGTHEVTFDATGLRSGVYFYRLEAADFVETKRMVVLK